MPDFSFPAWLRDQHSFADSLAKGAQVGAIIANNRYRNQALAAQVIQSERDYELREKQLESHNRTADLNYQLRSQLIEDQSADKTAITEWIQKRNELPLEQRLSMNLPSLKLPQSYEIANKMMDNDRLTFERSLKGRTQAALALRLSKLPADYIQRFEMEPDWDSKMQILAEGEQAARTATLDLYQPREMATEGGEKVFYNPKTGTFRFAPSPVTDEVTTRPITDETGAVIGHAMRSGDKWVRIPGAPRNPLENTLIKKRAELAGARKDPIGQKLDVSRLEAEVAELEKAIQTPTSAPTNKDPLGLFGP